MIKNIVVACLLFTLALFGGVVHASGVSAISLYKPNAVAITGGTISNVTLSNVALAGSSGQLNASGTKLDYTLIPAGARRITVTYSLTITGGTGLYVTPYNVSTAGTTPYDIATIIAASASNINNGGATGKIQVNTLLTTVQGTGKLVFEPILLAGLTYYILVGDSIAQTAASNNFNMHVVSQISLENITRLKFTGVAGTETIGGWVSIWWEM